MGYTTLLDIVGSSLTFGLLFLAALRLNASASENSFAYNQNYLLQRNMVVLTVMLEQDLNNLGAGANDPNGGIQSADTNDLIFKADLNRDGNAETIEWRVGPPSELPQTPNPNDRYLYRTVNGVVTKMNLGVTEFSFRYWRVDDPTTLITIRPIVPPKTTDPPGTINTGTIGPVEVYIKLESPYKMKLEYTNEKDVAVYEMQWRQLRSISRNNSIQFP